MNAGTSEDPHLESGTELEWPATQDPRDVFVPTSAGVVHLWRQGEGPPLLLMHSDGHSWREFERSIESLASRFDVLAWDMPGQGDSDPVHWRTSIAGYAQIAVEVLDHLQVDKAVVVGCSVGACIAACLATRFPDRVSAAGLVEFQAGGADFWQSNWEGAVRTFANPAQSREDVASRLVSDLDDALYERWTADRFKAGGRSMLGVVWALRNYPILRDVEQMSVPAVVMMGASGPTLHGKEKVEALLGADQSLVVIEGAGHFVALDKPADFATQIAGLGRFCA